MQSTPTGTHLPHAGLLGDAEDAVQPQDDRRWVEQHARPRGNERADPQNIEGGAQTMPGLFAKPLLGLRLAAIGVLCSDR